MKTHRYTAFIEEELFDDLLKIKALTGHSVNKLLNRAGRKSIDEMANEIMRQSKQRQIVRNAHTNL
jgi:hypothetical protein|tara:strand:+ start:425 stop:622 length:198 start_codon:yes stop_codon:yes gene_type:complete